MASSNKKSSAKKKQTTSKKTTSTQKKQSTKKTTTAQKKQTIKTTASKQPTKKTVNKNSQSKSTAKVTKSSIPKKQTEIKKTKVDIKEEKQLKDVVKPVEKEEIDVASHVKTIFEVREEEKNYLKKIKILLVIIILVFSALFIADLLTNKERFKKVTNPEKSIPIKLEVTMKIEDYVGKNEKLSDFYLNLIGYDNSNQVTHPKVLRFPEKWNGYKYWVAYTPYPYGDAAKENPFIMVSNDLVNWKTMKNFDNPLDEPEDKNSSKVYNSDTHLVYIKETNTLECYWRYVNDKTHKVIVYKKTTKDGVNWSKKEIFLESDRRYEDYLSPAIMYKDKKYLVWYVDRDLKIKYTEYDTEKGEWTTPIAIELEFEESPIVKPWHLDVIETDKGYEMILVGFYEWTNRSNMHLYYTKSEDNETWDKAKTILIPNEGSGLYRSSILFINNTYYIFYSDIVNKRQRGVGIVYGTDIEHLNGLQSKDKDKFINYIKLNG